MPKTLTVIKASAGSGKTYTLAKKYIEQILFVPGKGGKLELRKTKDYHQHILAITFTNKATNEMKTRIVKELYKLSTDTENSDYYSDFVKACSSTEELREAASNALSSILFDYSSFHISTIDSFFQLIMRNFARELDRDYNYDVEIQAESVIRMATLNFLLSLGKDHARAGNSRVEKWVKDYIQSQVNQGKSWNSFFKENKSSYNDNSLTGFAKNNLDNEFVKEHLEELSKYLSESPAVKKDESEKSDTAPETEPKEKKWAALERIEDFKKLLENAVENFKKIDWKTKADQYILGYNIDTSTLLANSAIWKMYNGDCINQTNKTMLAGAADGAKNFRAHQAPTNQAALDKAKELAAEVCSGVDACNLFENMSKQLAYVGLLGELYKKMEEYRQDNNVVLISDTTQLINKIVQSTGDAPFIYERLGAWINTYMLDEFQDTSRMQYENFKPLLEESLSQGKFNLVIGDAKQSIYRFRNADPALFRDKIDEEFQSYIDPADNDLRTNYRSLTNIVNFNNGFTDKLVGVFAGDYPAIAKTYKNHSQKVSSKNKEEEPGMVKVMFKDKSNNVLEKIDNVMPGLPEYLLDLHKRFEWKEIIILINKHTDGETIVNRILEHNNMPENKERQIPVMSGEMLSLSHSASVKRIIGLLRFIDLTSMCTEEEDEDLPYDNAQARFNRNRQKDQKKCMVMSKFVEKVSHSTDDSETAIGQLLNDSFNEVNDEINQSQLTKSKYYATELEKLLPDREKQPMSLLNIVDKLISSQLAHTEREEESLFLHAFQDCIVKFTTKNSGGTVHEFLHYWDECGHKLNVPNAGAANAITIMTIHKAKGLEANCVVIPCANWNIKNTGGEYWIDRETWLDMGGRELADRLMKGWCEEIIPPIMRIGKNELRQMKAYNMFDNFCLTEDQNDLIDILNKTYVAFTRPCKELHVFAVGSSAYKIDKKTHKTVLNAVNTIGQHLETKFPKLDGVYQVLDDDGLPIEGHYALGTPCKKDAGGEKDKGWTNKEMPTYDVNINLTPVKLPEDEASIREVGKRLHYMLSLINDYSNLDTALDYCLRRGIITNKEDDAWNKDKLRSMLTEQFSESFHDGLVCQWFAPENKCYNERSFVIEDGNHNRVSARPDRIVKRGDTYTVIDYKWGGRKDEEYSEQVRRYMRVLRNSGKRDVKGYVWYVARKEILPVEI